MNDNLTLATFIATVLNLEVNIEIMRLNRIRTEQQGVQNKLLGEIVELLKRQNNART